LDYLDELTLEESEGARKQQKQLTANKNSIRKKQTNKQETKRARFILSNFIPVVR